MERKASAKQCGEGRFCNNLDGVGRLRGLGRPNVSYLRKRLSKQSN